MKKGTIMAVIAVLLVTQVMLSSCRKTETTGAKPSPEAHQNEMLKRSFEGSKKVIAAKVNGETITEFLVVREMNALAPQYLADGRQAKPEFNEKIRRDALNILITQELAVQEARKRGMKVTPETVDREIKKVKTETGSEEAFQAYLDKNGLTEQELRTLIEQDALFEMIATQEVDAKITVTDAALRARYKREKAGLKDAAHRQMTFEAAKGLLEQKIRDEAAEKKMREWEKELRKNARIEILEQTRPQG